VKSRYFKNWGFLYVDVQNLPPPAPVNHNLNSGQSTPVPKPTKRTKRELVANDYNDPEVSIGVCIQVLLTVSCGAITFMRSFPW